MGMHFLRGAICCYDKLRNCAETWFINLCQHATKTNQMFTLVVVVFSGGWWVIWTPDPKCYFQAHQAWAHCPCLWCAVFKTTAAPWEDSLEEFLASFGPDENQTQCSRVSCSIQSSWLAWLTLQLLSFPQSLHITVFITYWTFLPTSWDSVEAGRRKR